ncbi:MAG: hypothetical protein EAZ99_03485 [Alphaproteobacteria bacterium]|nr:MAG: hypothetical protein EAZ99_03485 [Alphaproteobacteria bacterium]
MVKVAEFVSVGRQVLGHSSTTPPPVTEPPEAPGLAALRQFDQYARDRANNGVDDDGDVMVAPTRLAVLAAERFLSQVPVREPQFVWVGNPEFDLVPHGDNAGVTPQYTTVRFHEDGRATLVRKTESGSWDIIDISAVLDATQLRVMFAPWF